MTKQNSVVVGGANVHHNSSERLVLALNIPRSFPDGRHSAEAQMERSLEDAKTALTQWGDLFCEDTVRIVNHGKFKIADIASSKPSNGERSGTDADVVLIYAKLPGTVNRGNYHGDTGPQQLLLEYEVLAAHVVKAAKQYWNTTVRSVKAKRKATAEATA